MDIFDLLTMIGGLSLFLFGMNIMGQALERRAGGQLRTLLGKLTANRAMGMLTGLLVTAVIQSSSATTVMVVGFVNSGLMTLGQAIYVIMGANVGTTITAWVLSLAGISSGNIWVKLLKPSSFTPVLALIGIVLYMSKKDDKRRDTGTILLGFATLMFGMETMSGAVAGLGEIPTFQQLFVTFQNPFLGLLAGAVLTALIQSSSASVGILQALAKTGQVSYGAAIPIIMGQNIGTCVTAMLSSVGANRGARRAAMVHLLFNVVGSGVWLTIFWLVKALLQPALLSAPATLLGIAVSHSAFNILCTLLMLPLAGWLERAVTALVPNGQEEEAPVELDQRLLATPAAALEQSRALTAEMSRLGAQALREALAAWEDDTPQRVRTVKALEKKTDHYEDILGTYLIRLSERPISGEDSREAAKLLKLIGDFERVADHAVNLAQAAEELREKDLTFSREAMAEKQVLGAAVEEVLDRSIRAFLENDLALAATVEPLEQVVDQVKEEMRTRHILRLQRGECSVEAGFVWNDLLTDLERVSDHCSNIAGCVMEMAHNDLNVHSALRRLRHEDEAFQKMFEEFQREYSLE
ncbi:MAG: Na/Pi cotransporter family protein [Oscillospiraceae bacterium]|jgi:phosphate:Na+ symporter|nr:Na/Pi cotransporter family protein [Oscillospiraceae bacterium]